MDAHIVPRFPLVGVTFHQGVIVAGWNSLSWGITGIQSDNQNNNGTPKMQNDSVLSNYLCIL